VSIIPKVSKFKTPEAEDIKFLWIYRDWHHTLEEMIPKTHCNFLQTHTHKHTHTHARTRVHTHTNKMCG